MNEKDFVPNILKTFDVSFTGLSHFYVDTNKVQHLYLLSDGDIQFESEVALITVFREIFCSFLGILGKNLKYEPSMASDETLRNDFAMLTQKFINAQIAPLPFYQQLFQFMQKDPEGFSSLDPLLIIRGDKIYLEAVDKQGRRTLLLEFTPDIWQKDSTLSTFHSTDGEARIFITPELLLQIEQITSRSELILHVGKDVGAAEIEDTWKGIIQKKYCLPLEWARSVLFLQGVTGLGLHKVDMIRMDIFNVLTYLRLHKAKTSNCYDWTNEKESDNIVFSLKPGSSPILMLEPWKEEFVFHDDIYSGDKEYDLEIFGYRRDLLLLDRLMPYTKSAHMTLFDSAMHTSMELEGEGFCCVLNLQGFSSANWSRRLQLETMMPEFQPRSTLSDSNVQKWLTQLDQDGQLDLSTLGDISLVQRKQLLSEILRGTVNYLPTRQMMIKRTFFDLQDSEIQQLHRLGYQDELAYELVAQRNVQIQSSFQTDGTLDFSGSRVKEPAKVKGNDDFIATPRMVLQTDGQLRKINCSCTVFKDPDIRNRLGGGAVCAHIRALWLTYCVEKERIREAEDAGEDTGPVLYKQTRLTKNTDNYEEERFVSFDVRSERKFIFTEIWISQGEQRQSKQLYTTAEQAQLFYEKRIQKLLDCGYTT